MAIHKFENNITHLPEVGKCAANWAGGASRKIAPSEMLGDYFENEAHSGFFVL